MVWVSGPSASSAGIGRDSILWRGQGVTMENPSAKIEA